MQRASITRTITAAGAATIIGTALLISRGQAVRASSPAAILRCSNIQVVITPYRSLGAAAGHLGMWYRVHELWGSACALQGYPGVELMDRVFHSVPTHLGRGGYIIAGAARPRQVVLDSRHDAYFAMEYTDVQIKDAPCPAAPYLLVTPPNDFLPDVAYSGGIAPCAGQVDVSPIESRLSWN